jgi:hypothetical protein
MKPLFPARFVHVGPCGGRRERSGLIGPILRTCPVDVVWSAAARRLAQREFVGTGQRGAVVASLHHQRRQTARQQDPVERPSAAGRANADRYPRSFAQLEPIWRRLGRRHLIRRRGCGFSTPLCSAAHVHPLSAHPSIGSTTRNSFRQTVHCRLGSCGRVRRRPRHRDCFKGMQSCPKEREIVSLTFGKALGASARTFTRDQEVCDGL